MKPTNQKDSTQMQQVLREYCSSVGSQKAAADRMGVSPGNICDMLKGRREISAKIAEKLGHRRILIYEVIQ